VHVSVSVCSWLCSWFTSAFVATKDIQPQPWLMHRPTVLCFINLLADMKLGDFCLICLYTTGRLVFAGSFITSMCMHESPTVVFSHYYLCQGERSEHWWRLSNRAILFVCLSIHMMIQCISDVMIAMTSFYSASSISGIYCYYFSFLFPCRKVALPFSLPCPWIYSWMTPVAMATKFETKL